MNVISIKKGLDIPINGAPKQELAEEKFTRICGIVGLNYIGLKPKLMVLPDNYVKAGQVLFVEKRDENIKYTSPINGKLLAINRGEKRAFQSIIIEKTGDDYIEFEKFDDSSLSNISADKIKHLLSQTGLWVSFRTRPFDKVPLFNSTPNSIFINAMDTNPLAPNPDIIIKIFEKDFLNGIKIVSKLCYKVFLCQKSSSIPSINIPNVTTFYFNGPHPAGLSGTHIHFLDPVGPKKTVWYINYQDVIAIGKTFTEGKLYSKRVISLAGPEVKNPRLITTYIGADIEELFKDELINNKNVRLISGSPIYGYQAEGPVKYLGRYNLQVCALSNEVKRSLLGWISPGLSKFSIKKVVISSFLKNKRLSWNTALNGSKRAIVPIGAYEKVMPLDIHPTFLFKALSIKNIEEAERLGCLELGEEDLALSTFVCPGKNDWMKLLRETLNIIEKEG